MKIIVDGLLVTYSDTGIGKVVVLLHGWGTSMQNMSSIADNLSSRYRVISLDLPGFGQSEQPKADWYVGDYAALVSSLLQKLGVTSIFAIVGHSFGGRVTIKAVGEGIMTPQKVVLIGAAGIKHRTDVRRAGYVVIAKAGKILLSLPGLRGVSQKAKSVLYKSTGNQDYVQSGTMKQIFLHTIREDLSDQAVRMTLPALLIWGEHDKESTIEDARQFNKLIKGSELHIIPDSGHFVHTEQSDTVNSLIRTFLT